MKGKELKKRLWKAEEDMLLKAYVETHGEGNWSGVSKKLGLQRGAKSCRLRWKNYLRPDIKHGSMSKDEEDLIIRMHKLIGNRWSLIAGRLPGRTDNEVKNYWNTHLSKRVNPRAQPKRKASEIEDNGQQKRAKVEGGHEQHLGSTSTQEPKPEVAVDEIKEDGGSWSAGELLESRDGGNLGCGVMGMDLGCELMIYDAQIQWENADFVSFDGFGINWELETILPPSSSSMFNTN